MKRKMIFVLALATGVALGSVGFAQEKELEAVSVEQPIAQCTSMEVTPTSSSEVVEISLPPAEQEIAAMEAAFKEVTSFFSSFIIEMKCSLASLSAADQAINSKYESLKLKVNDVLKAFEIFNRFMESAQAQLDDHEERITELEKQGIGYLQRKVLQLEQSVQALQAKIENNRAKIEGFEASLADLTGRVNYLESLLNEMKETFVSRSEFESFQADTQAKLDELQAAVSNAFTIAIVVPLITAIALYYFLGGAGG